MLNFIKCPSILVLGTKITKKKKTKTKENKSSRTNLSKLKVQKPERQIIPKNILSFWSVQLLSDDNSTFIHYY